VELQPEANQLSLLVRTGLRGEEMSSLCWLIFAAVESLVKEWYNLEVRPLPEVHSFFGFDLRFRRRPEWKCRVRIVWGAAASMPRRTRSPSRSVRQLRSPPTTRFSIAG
jgi:hypothetical protein